jgi:hypothetical protein
MNRSEAVIYGSAVIYLAESLAFLARPFQLPASIVRFTYPQSHTLALHCEAHECLYNSNGVSSLYTVQAVTFLLATAWLIWASLRSSNERKDTTARNFCLLVIAGAIVDYAIGNFSFKPIWLLPNSVATSPLGLFRYALLFWIATVAALITSNIISPGEIKNAHR